MRFSLRQVLAFVTFFALICGVAAFFWREHERQSAIIQKKVWLGHQLRQEVGWDQLLDIQRAHGVLSSFPSTAECIVEVGNSDNELRLYICQTDMSYRTGYIEFGAGVDGENWEFWILDKNNHVVGWSRATKAAIVKEFNAFQIDVTTIQVDYHLLDGSVESIELEIFPLNLAVGSG